MEISEIRRKKDFETKNARLKHINANLTLETDAVKDILQKKSMSARRLMRSARSAHPAESELASRLVHWCRFLTLSIPINEWY
jgi:putative transposase